MANEPERPIEKLLRAAAKKRRDEAGVPLALHPANRRVLQGEVARRFARTAGEPRSLSRVLGQLWPRFAWGAAICAVLAVAGYLLLPTPGTDRSEALLARNKSVPLTMPAKEPLPSPPVNEAPALAPSAPAPAANPRAAAFVEPPPPALAKPARQLGVDRYAPSKDSMAAPADREVKEKPATAAAPQLADRQKASEIEVAASGGAIQPAPAGSAGTAFERQYGLAGKPVPPASMPAAPASPAPVAATTAAASVVAADELAKAGDAKAEQSGVAYKSLATAALANRPQPSQVAADGRLQPAAQPRDESRSIGFAQRFAQVAPALETKGSRAHKATSAQPVLASFQVEQAGPELRIVDGDGSVYSGYVQLADVARRERSANAAAPAVSRAPQALGGVVAAKPAANLDAVQPAPQNYFFRVAGTNRSLNKQVVFTGNLMAATNVAWFQPVTNQLRLRSSVADMPGGSAQPGLLPLLNSRISGKVVVGNGKAIEINALPTSP